MRKKFRKITAIVLTVAMAFSVTTPVFADSQPEAINGEWRVISWDEIPEGVMPVKVDSLSEADAMVSAVRGNIMNMENASLEENNISLFSIADSQKKNNGGPMIGTGFWVQIVYNYTGNQFEEITSITSGLSGITMYLSWEQTNDWHNFTNNNSTVETHVAGDLTSYIIHEDFPMAWTDHYDDIQTDFSLPKV